MCSCAGEHDRGEGAASVEAWAELEMDQTRETRQGSATRGGDQTISPHSSPPTPRATVTPPNGRTPRRTINGLGFSVSPPPVSTPAAAAAAAAEAIVRLDPEDTSGQFESPLQRAATPAGSPSSPTPAAASTATTTTDDGGGAGPAVDTVGPSSPSLPDDRDGLVALDPSFFQGYITTAQLYSTGE